MTWKTGLALTAIVTLAWLVVGAAGGAGGIASREPLLCGVAQVSCKEPVRLRYATDDLFHALSHDL